MWCRLAAQRGSCEALGGERSWYWYFVSKWTWVMIGSSLSSCLIWHNANTQVTLLVTVCVIILPTCWYQVQHIPSNSHTLCHLRGGGNFLARQTYLSSPHTHIRPVCTRTHRETLTFTQYLAVNNNNAVRSQFLSFSLGTWQTFSTLTHWLSNCVCVYVVQKKQCVCVIVCECVWVCVVQQTVRHELRKTRL